ncbi:MAG: preprotein translocase subunit SecG [Flavobacteriales bacterium]
MLQLIGVLLIIVCLLLIITVMVQNPKGGGLSSTFGGGNQVLGVQKTTNFLEKMTWAMAIALLVLVVGSHLIGNPQGEGDKIEINQEILDSASQQQVEEGLDIEDAQDATPVTPPTQESNETPAEDATGR